MRVTGCLAFVSLAAVLALAGCAPPGLGGASDAINGPVCHQQAEMAAQGVVGDGTMTITCP